MPEPFDLPRLRNETFLQGVEYHAELDSTNSFALRMAATEAFPCPMLVLADRQWSGRGRGTNTWWSGPGSLTFSVVIEPHQLGPPQVRGGRASLGTALAVWQCLAAAVPRSQVQVKWPNDVCLDEKKVCGILVETSVGARPVLVIGVGVNVNNSFDDAPSELKARSIALCDAAGHRFDRTALLIDVLRKMADLFQGLSTGAISLRAQWQQACMLSGRLVLVEHGSQVWTGVCEGIDEDGALLLRSPHGLLRCAAGTVSQFA